MILFSDGKEENPAEAYTLEAALEKARGKNLPIFSVGYTKVDKQFLQYMERIADETGGSYYHAPSPESLNQHFPGAAPDPGACAQLSGLLWRGWHVKRIE